MYWRRWGSAAVGLLLGVLTTVPLLASGYWVRVLTSVFMMAVIAQGINLVLGLAGYLAMGNVVFFGTGAYVTGVLMVKFGTPFFPALAGSAVLAGLYAALLGLPVLRLKGGYFTIATIGINQATREIFTNMEATGGGHGLGLPLIDADPRLVFGVFYFAFLVLMILTVVLMRWIARSRFGYALMAIRDSEEAAAVMGIDTTGAKVAAWSISAMVTALAGGLYGYYISFLEPGFVFDITLSVKAVIMTLLGGMGTVLGPVAGAGAVEILTDVVWSKLLDFHMLVLGLVIVLAVRLMPQGLPGLISRRKGMM